MMRKAGFGLFTLVLCLLGGPWEGPPVRIVVTPVDAPPALSHAPLEPMPPLAAPRVSLAEVEAPPTRARARAVRVAATQSVTRSQGDRVASAPKRNARYVVRTVARKSPYVAGKAHYPYVRPAAWGPGYPAS